ncbi:hypothetical protein DITRI_Ditri02bG0138200 [Diplodiscus trichospermus]
MLGSTDENEPVQVMMKDQFANYVVQKVLETCGDWQLELILNRKKVHFALKKYTYEKHIVACVEKLVAAGGHVTVSCTGIALEENQHSDTKPDSLDAVGKRSRCTVPGDSPSGDIPRIRLAEAQMVNKLMPVSAEETKLLYRLMIIYHTLSQDHFRNMVGLSSFRPKTAKDCTANTSTTTARGIG